MCQGPWPVDVPGAAAVGVARRFEGPAARPLGGTLGGTGRRHLFLQFWQKMVSDGNLNRSSTAHPASENRDGQAKKRKMWLIGGPFNFMHNREMVEVVVSSRLSGAGNPQTVYVAESRTDRDDLHTAALCSQFSCSALCK